MTRVISVIAMGAALTLAVACGDSGGGNGDTGDAVDACEELVDFADECIFAGGALIGFETDCDEVRNAADDVSGACIDAYIDFANCAVDVGCDNFAEDLLDDCEDEIDELDEECDD